MTMTRRNIFTVMLVMVGICLDVEPSYSMSTAIRQRNTVEDGHDDRHYEQTHYQMTFDNDDDDDADDRERQDGFENEEVPTLDLPSKVFNDGHLQYELYLDADHNVVMRWSLDYENSEVQVEVRAKTAAPNDAIAVGFSDYGDIAHADLCVLWWDSWSNAHFQDVWTDFEGRIHLDEKQDCHLKRLRRDREGVIFAFRRPFDTCDERDFILDDGTIHVVHAIIDGPIDRIQGVTIGNETSHGFQRAQMLKPKQPPPPVNSAKDIKAFSVLADETQVPSDETTYWCRLVQLPRMATKRHVVQFEAVIQPGHETLVHHMEVFHCETPKGRRLPYYNGPCTGPERPVELEPCRKVIAAWAMGAPPLIYPEEAGFPIGGPDFAEYVVLEIHYNNEKLRADYVDSSGIRFLYTSRLRRHDAAVLEVGLEYTPKMSIPPKQPRFILSGHCIVECTETALSPSGIVLFAAQLHTHLTGKQVVVRHYRGAQELAEVARDDHFSPHFQEIRHLKKPTLILPGDALVTSCTYNTMDRENITLGGFAIREEMCVSYIHYYPKSELEVCKSSIDSDVLDDYFRYLHEQEDQKTSSELDVSDNYRAIDWTPMRSEMLHNLYDVAPLSMQCNKSSGDRFPGYWNNAPQTKILWRLPARPRICSLEGSEYILSDSENV